MQTVELLLDPTTDAAVRAEWQRLAEAGLPSQARHHGGTNAPHITLGVAEMIPEEVERRLSLAALRIFEAAGRTESFALAAAELDLSPSAVSHAIRKLEEAAGIALFTRGTRAIVLTGKEAWFAFMNSKSRTARRRSPVRTRPQLERGYRAPISAACSHGASATAPRARWHPGPR